MCLDCFFLGKPLANNDADVHNDANVHNGANVYMHKQMSYTPDAHYNIVAFAALL